MPRVMGVAFGPHGRLRYLDAGDGDYAVGEPVRIPTEGGPEVAHCVWGPVEIDWADEKLPRVLGAATPADLARDEANTRRRAEIWATADELIARHRLPMRIVAVDYLDRDPEVGRLVAIYFKAPHRVDFRALVGDLARTLRARVDLRQLGARDVAALIGDAGPCGRQLCCSACPVSAAVPSDVTESQEAANSALQLSGSCGRLKCCMAYEADAYADFALRAPAVGSLVDTPDGEGVVSGHAQPFDAVWVRESECVRSVPVCQARVIRPAPGPDRPAQDA